MLIEGLPLWLAETNAWLVAPRWPGGRCVRLDVEGEPVILFGGDHLFQGSIGRTDLPGGSFEALMESMAEKILPMDDAVQVLPGHGGVTTVGEERRFNPFLLELQADLKR